jgi:hypothetical protein
MGNWSGAIWAKPDGAVIVLANVAAPSAFMLYTLSDENTDKLPRTCTFELKAACPIVEIVLKFGEAEPPEKITPLLYNPPVKLILVADTEASEV